MELNVFSVYDEKAGAYLPPWTLPTVAMAKRVFGNCVNDQEHQFCANPEDYTLFKLATFDDRTGRLNVCDHNISYGNGVEYIKYGLANDRQQIVSTVGHSLTNGEDSNEAT